MENHAVWNEQSQSLLKYLYENMKIYNWATIAHQLTDRLNQNFTKDGCRNRYALISNPVIRDEWTPQEQQELYRLHNQNGNKWAIIAQNLLGRTDNCVKNHFYSKMRKSLRTLNKIGKLYLKKMVREVSNTVLYKLTQATDQALKQNPEISEQLISLCFDLKTRLLNYDVDQKDIKDGFEYNFEKNLLLDLTTFSRLYKKKSKKEKNSAMGSQNLKKLHEKKRKEKEIKMLSQNMFNHEYELSSQKQEEINPLNLESNRVISQSSSRVPKVAKTVVLKAPTELKVISIKTPDNGVKIQQLFSPLFPKEAKKSSGLKPTPGPSQNPNINEVQDILKNHSILQQGDDDSGANNINYFRRVRSNSSFSVISNSNNDSNPLDMFGDDFNLNSRFKQLSGAQEDNHFFGGQSNSFQN